jgi:hypothetical protein
MMLIGIAVMLAMVALGAPACACLGSSSESYVLTEYAPKLAGISKNTMVMEVSLEKKPDPYKLFYSSKPVKANVLRVLAGSYQKKSVSIYLRSQSSCDQLSPLTDSGRISRGFITGHIVDVGGKMMFVPVKIKPPQFYELNQ